MLKTDELINGQISDDLYDLAGTRGLFDYLRFVVRLRPDMYRLLVDEAGGTSPIPEADPATVNAFSTYFHETLHWWQHIGSTTGLMLSFSSPAKAHINRTNLLALLERIGPTKSLRTFDRLRHRSLTPEQSFHLNIVLNTWHDLEFNWRIIVDPRLIASVKTSPYFESVGHSLQIGLANTIWMLAATFDKEFSILPDIRKWEEPFAELRDKRVDGFYFGSPIKLSPVGALHIFEGQARFSQIQYLYLATQRRLSWSDFRRQGMLSDRYVQAFDFFRSALGIDWPASPVSPEVQLFLLLCDLAINPSDGYPFDLRHFESFVISDDPGIRFYWFCTQAAKTRSLRTAISKCSRNEYEEVSSVLCRSITCATPLELSRELVRWCSESQALKDLLNEEETSDFPNENLPVRICFAKHLLYAADKLRRPEFFCWPAMFMADHGMWSVNLNDSLRLFSRHQPLFIATLDGEIRPALFADRPMENVYQAFNDFYMWIVQYDLVDQWIIRDGEFDLDFTKLSPGLTPDNAKPHIDQHFRDLWGVSLDDFVLIP